MTRSSALRRTALLAAGALVLAACGSQVAPGGSGGSGTSSPTAPTAPAVIDSLDAAQAAWAASPASTGEYQLTIVQQCFCPGISLSVTVAGGKVVDETASSTDNSGGSVAPGPLQGFPRTVEDLHAVVRAGADASSLTVVYDRRGVPLRIWVDPILNAVDDEHGYSVTFATTDEDLAAPTGSGTWTRDDLPAGSAFPADLPMPGQGSAQAVVVRSGGTARLYLGLWGSGSCPQVPRTLSFAPATEGTTRLAPTIRATVEVDSTTPAGRACTADYGPTVYSAPLPDEVAAALAQPQADAEGSSVVPQGASLLLVVETVGGTEGDTSSGSSAVDAAL